MEVHIPTVVVDAQGRHPFSRLMHFPRQFPSWQPQWNLHLCCRHDEPTTGRVEWNQLSLVTVTGEDKPADSSNSCM